MLDGKAIINIINDNERVVHLPFVITEEIIQVVRDVEGVTFSRPNPFGKYEIGYEIGRCFVAELIDKNVRYAIDQYIKNRKPGEGTII